jgi:hypothetical protein
MRLRIALVALLAVATIAAACGDDDDTGGYSDAIRDSYMQGCTGSQNEAFCECTLNELEKRYTQEEFIRFAIEASETPPDDLVDISLACIGEADLGG